MGQAPERGTRSPDAAINTQQGWNISIKRLPASLCAHIPSTGVLTANSRKACRYKVRTSYTQSHPGLPDLMTGET